MSRPGERGTGGSGTPPLTATRRMYRAGTGTALTMQAAVGRAALAASRIAARHQLAWIGATTGTADADADLGPDAVEATGATTGRTAEPDEARERARAVESAGEATAEAIESAGEATPGAVDAAERATAEVVDSTGRATAELADAHAASASTFDRFLDAAAPFRRPDDGGGR